MSALTVGNEKRWGLMIGWGGTLASLTLENFKLCINTDIDRVYNSRCINQDKSGIKKRTCQWSVEKWYLPRPWATPWHCWHSSTTADRNHHKASSLFHHDNHNEYVLPKTYCVIPYSAIAIIFVRSASIDLLIPSPITFKISWHDTANELPFHKLCKRNLVRRLQHWWRNRGEIISRYLSQWKLGGAVSDFGRRSCSWVNPTQLIYVKYSDMNATGP